MPVIALLSDLGEKDYFVGAMKGAILSINPKVTIVDITHEVPRHDIFTAAFMLVNAAETFPNGTIFVVVVDPGVGTERRDILLRTNNDFHFIGPDNGVFTLVARRFGVKEIRELTNRKLMRESISATFHGRDVFAPVAAHLSLGVRTSEVGPVLPNLKKLDLAEAEMVGGEISGEVVAIDGFGNLLTNIGRNLIETFARLGDVLKLEISGKNLPAKFVRTFGEVGPGEVLCYVGSAGVLEIAKNLGNLAEDLGAHAHLKIRLKKTG
ncbi:MAG: S-adenosyl-l-methionine hydroxide adenosyltransferase family protein [Candidatus Hadarchaeum sp.]|uniref:SAM hydrolase/SAM-dependent halogenase family protein n=1 Tax=Candidatus Hadarchaeum sp. TaxID=2883567 RepID=UPI0031702AC3